MPICNEDDGLNGFDGKKWDTFEFQLGGGFSSGEQTSEVIKKLVNDFKKNPTIRNLSVRIVSKVASNDYIGEAKALYEWVRDNIRYVRDIRGVETLQWPTVTLPSTYSDLGIGAGDCDDHVILLASMLLSLGMKDVYMRIVTFRPTCKEWRHIYLVIKQNGKEYPLDAIIKNKKWGFEAPYYDKKDIAL